MSALTMRRAFLFPNAALLPLPWRCSGGDPVKFDPMLLARFFHNAYHTLQPTDSRTDQPGLGRFRGPARGRHSTPEVAPRAWHRWPTAHNMETDHRAHRLHRGPDPAPPTPYRCRSTHAGRNCAPTTRLPEAGRTHRPPTRTSARSTSSTTVFSTPVRHAIP